MNLQNFTDQEARMPFIRFERLAIEDPKASLEAGHYVAKDIDMALITPPYSKDVMKYKVQQWLAQIKIDVANDRLPQEWADKYMKMYDAWKNGQELPLDGTPIRGWGVIGPAQQETLIKMHVLTVESLAAMTDEGVSRVGMGGRDLKNKAIAWLGTLKKAGRPTLEISALRKENEQLRANQEVLEKRIESLILAIKSKADIDEVNQEMSADELFD